MDITFLNLRYSTFLISLVFSFTETLKRQLPKELGRLDVNSMKIII